MRSDSQRNGLLVSPLPHKNLSAKSDSLVRSTIVARHGKVVHFKAHGMMDVEANKPMRKDTIFRIYSMTKPIAAVAVMMLCEEGKLQLDAPVSSYLSELGGLKVAADADGKSLTLIEADREMTVRGPDVSHRWIARGCPIHGRTNHG